MIGVPEEIPVRLVVPTHTVVGHLELLAEGGVQPGGVLQVTEHAHHCGMGLVRQPRIFAHPKSGLFELSAGQGIHCGAMHARNSHFPELRDLSGTQHIMEGCHIGIQAVLLQLQWRQKAIRMVSPAIATPQLLADNWMHLSSAHLFVFGELLR